MKLAGTVMGDVVADNIFQGASITVAAGTMMGEVRAHNIFHAASIAVVG